MTTHRFQIYYCHRSENETVISEQKPDGFKTLESNRRIYAPTPEVATMIFETDLRLWKLYEKETGKNHTEIK